MSFANVCKDRFDPGVQRRGITYFATRRVKLSQQSKNSFAARVIGSAGNTYFVTVEWDDRDREIMVTCECPYAKDFGECKHIWASFLEADKQGMRLSDSRGGWQVVFGGETDAYEEEDDDFYFPEQDPLFDDSDLSSSFRVVGNEVAAQDSRNTQKSLWKRKFAGVLGTAGPREGDHVMRSEQSLRCGKRIVCGTESQKDKQ